MKYNTFVDYDVSINHEFYINTIINTYRRYML